MQIPTQKCKKRQGNTTHSKVNCLTIKDGIDSEGDEFPDEEFKRMRLIKELKKDMDKHLNEFK
jgi:hypothetical protein